MDLNSSPWEHLGFYATWQICTTLMSKNTRTRLAKQDKVKVWVTFKFIMINNLIKDRNFEIVNLLSTEQKRAVPSELYINSVISFC